VTFAFLREFIKRCWSFKPEIIEYFFECI